MPLNEVRKARGLYGSSSAMKKLFQSLTPMTDLHSSLGEPEGFGTQRRLSTPENRL